MVAFEIGDIVSAVVDFEFNDFIFPTIGVSGTVTSRSVVSFVEEEGEDDIYDYQVSYTSPIEGINPDTQETSTIDVIWFTSAELGLDVATGLVSTIDSGEVEVSLQSAKSNSASAISTVENILPGIGASTSKDTISNYLTAIRNIDTSLSTLSIDRETSDLEEATSYNVAVQVDYIGNDVVILQEASENLAQIQSVVDQRNAQTSQNAEQLAQQTEAGNEATEQDFNAYIDNFAVLNVDPRIPTDVQQDPITIPETQLTDTSVTAEVEESVFEFE